MRARSWVFRLLGLGLVAAMAGAAAYPYPVNPYLSRKGIGSLAEADEYYAAIVAPATFVDWYAQYFPDTTNTVEARYYNAADLGFGREMHCREEYAFTACYVVNHGLGAAAPAELAVRDTVAGARALPTVAMVYNYLNEGNPNDVMFYIYDVAGALIQQVALDSEGDKAVPHLCLPCHGGDYDAANNAVSGASFLPFDAGSFFYSGQPGYTRAGQEEPLRRLNAFVYNSFPDPKIKALIDGWYGGLDAVYTPTRKLNADYLPAAFDGSDADRALYTEVARPYCRGCHVAQGYALETPAQFDLSAFSSVYQANDMPHAEVTAHNFWSSSAPATLARSRGWAYRVTTLEDTPPPYSCAPDDCSLREAILAANASPDLSVIVFDLDGAFTLAQAGANENLSSTGDLDLRTDVILLGNGAGRTVLDGNGLDRVLHIQTGVHIVIQGVTIRGGLAEDAGGGIRNDGSLLTLNYSVLRDNHTALGVSGGGLAALSGAITRINQSTIGPGNVGGNLGGGVFNDGSLLEIRNSTVSGNSARLGGGLHNNNNSVATLIHTTVAFNHASISGGGVATAGGSSTEAGRSLLAGNTSAGQSNCFSDAATHTSLGHNLLGQNGSAGGCPMGTGDEVLAGGIVSAIAPGLQPDPVYGVLVHQPHPLGPALDAIPLGVDCATPSYDARNLARPRDAGNDGSLACDIGAVELISHEAYLPLIKR
ncbi:MAG: CSLREA domain-containing protein [Anaerolineales bacterium]|nr:CSLREA domain-containing protein [Anaerolineales bacterium]